MSRFKQVGYRIDNFIDTKGMSKRDVAFCTGNVIREPVRIDPELAFDENFVSPYSADDSDDINEYGNYWRNWEYAEMLSSASFCDFQINCWECPSAFDNPDEIDIVPCERSTKLEGFIMTMNPEIEPDFFKPLLVIRNGELETWRVRRW